VPGHDQAIRCVRAIRPGGIVATTVWDTRGDMPNQRMFWDIAAVLDPAARS
jgi:hypothetical protein